MLQKIFIPLLNNNGEDSEISLHFGHAPYFGLYSADTKELIIKENKLDHNDARKSPVEQIIESANPDIVFARDIGQRAMMLFQEKNIKLKTGRCKTVKELIENVESLEDLKSGCGH
ncbi:MAG: NifB/NifX family molybdenum-iron cluster-binding protein [Patescibacteria group bacterium]|nr:NifB/NifX family molybdenum-iron cluster-binding protein [Patescibacteria group bacterium]